MDFPRVKGIINKGLICKTWEKCKHLTGVLVRKSPLISNIQRALKIKHRDGDLRRSNNKRVAPKGCLSIYVGAHKERFVMKMEYLNHQLFRSLLEEAESEYGFRSEGPLSLPCEVDAFIKVLMEIEDCYREEEEEGIIGRKKIKGCSNFVTGSHHCSYDRLLTRSSTVTTI